MNYIHRIQKKILDRWPISILICLVLLLYVSNYQSERSWLDSYSLKPDFEPSFSDYEFERNLLYSNDSDQACPIPKLKPYSIAVKNYLAKQNQTYKNCDYADKFPLLFNSNLDGEIVPAKTLEQFANLAIKECCYKQIKRGSKDDNDYTIEPECFPLSLEVPTKIPPSHEFIAISCTKQDNKVLRRTNRSLFTSKDKITDMHAFIHVKPEVEKRQDEAQKLFEDKAGNGKDRSKVNVVIFGIDAVSRMNFLRTMPKTYEYLMKKLNGVDLAGYNKVADNTFPNMLPMMTSLTASQIALTCGKNKTYDTCPFIWKEFAKQGYRTSYAEDQSHISIFNFERNGFIHPPADYYLRPLSVAANKHIAHQILRHVHLCYGPRLGFQVLLDNMRKFVHKMNQLQKPFFQFTWATSLSHDYLTAVELGDKHLLSAFEWLYNSGHLKNTVFVLMSDHGQRVEGFRNTLQGQLEDRLPFTIIVVPDWMKTGKYSKAYQNLQENKDRLVTTFDLHETIADLLDLRNIETPQIEMRAANLSNENVTLPQGISLFLPVPKMRTCKMAGIDESFCSCNYFKLVDPNNREAKKAAEAAVKNINSIVQKYRNCTSLKLSSVKMSQRAGKLSGGFEGYLVNFNTIPGDGMFEALVHKKKWNSYEVSGTISRTNLYGNQSYCVHDNLAKLYCYCDGLDGTVTSINVTEVSLTKSNITDNVKIKL